MCLLCRPAAAVSVSGWETVREDLTTSQEVQVCLHVVELYIISDFHSIDITLHSLEKELFSPGDVVDIIMHVNHC